MSEKKKIDEFDLMMKSILDEAQEAVPERVWEGISVELDKAARRKTVVLWWRRAAVGVAAAAVVALGVFFTGNKGNDLIPEEGMIAVVESPVERIIEPVDPIVDDEPKTYNTLLAEAEDVVKAADIAEAVKKVEAEENVMIEDEGTVEDEPAAGDESDSFEARTEKKAETVVKKEEAVEYFPEDWGEDEVRKKRNVSLVLAGLAGTNNSLNQRNFNAMMRPTVTPAPKKTEIEETSVKSSFGIPLSFGAGVKFELNSRWSVGAGLNYTYLTRQFYGKYTKVDDGGNIERVISSDIRNQQHYVGIPVNVFYDVINNGRIDFYAYAGGAVEKCVSDSYRLLNTSIHHKEKVEGVQLSANAGIGVEFMLGNHLGLYIDPSVRYYFRNRQPKSIRTVQPLMLGFEMGLRVKL